MTVEKTMNNVISTSDAYITLHSLVILTKEGFVEEKVVNEAIRLVPKGMFDFYINRDEISNVRILDKNAGISGNHYKISFEYATKYYTKPVTLYEIVTLLNKYPDLCMWTEKGKAYIGYID